MPHRHIDRVKMEKFTRNVISLCLLGVALLPPAAFGLYSSNSDVISLTASNFDKLVKNDDSVWIVEFYAPWCGHCKSLAPEYQKAAKALKGVVKVGAVNADEESSLGSQYGIKGFPTIKVFTNGKAEDYNGQRTAQGIVEAALRAARSKVEKILGGKTSDGGSSGGDGKSDVVELTDDNFDKLVLNSDKPWLVEFYAPWCGHCKNLKPHFDKAAKALKGKMNLGALDATVHTSKASMYDVKGYPTLKFFAPGSRKNDAEDYDGGRTAEDIITWGEEKAVASLPAPELTQIVNDDTLSKGCGDYAICVISVLPHILDCDAKCRNDYLDILKRQGEKYKRQSWAWLWAQAGDYLNLEESLDIGGFGYPALSAVNLKKGKFSLFRGSFSDDGISVFLRDLSYGKGSVAPLRGTSLPKLPDVEPWDGQDGKLEELPEEDLDDLDSKDEL